ncbi:MAG: hypothetical protein EOM41_01255 [Bacilli bacterium]|nr:hypothetical protein [Bacilli bacterium]
MAIKPKQIICNILFFVKEIDLLSLLVLKLVKHNSVSRYILFDNKIKTEVSCVICGYKKTNRLTKHKRDKLNRIALDSVSLNTTTVVIINKQHCVR